MVYEGALVYCPSIGSSEAVYEVITIEGDIASLRHLEDPTLEFKAFIWDLTLASDEDLW